MRFYAAACENCGGKLRYDARIDKWHCEHCGYLNEKEIPINYYATTIKDLHLQGPGFDAELTVEMIMKLNAAEASLKLGKYGDALNRFRVLCDDIPQEYRAWWGQIRSLTREFTAEVGDRKEISDLCELYDAMMHFVPAENRDEVEKQFMDYVQCQEQRLDQLIQELQVRRNNLEEERSDLHDHIREWEQAEYESSEQALMVLRITLLGALVVGLLSLSLLILGAAVIGIGYYFLVLEPALKQQAEEWENEKRMNIAKASRRLQEITVELEQIEDHLSRLAQ